MSNSLDDTILRSYLKDIRRIAKDIQRDTITMGYDWGDPINAGRALQIQRLVDQGIKYIDLGS